MSMLRLSIEFNPIGPVRGLQLGTVLPYEGKVEEPRYSTAVQEIMEREGR